MEIDSRPAFNNVSFDSSFSVASGFLTSASFFEGFGIRHVDFEMTSFVNSEAESKDGGRPLWKESLKAGERYTSALIVSSHDVEERGVMGATWKRRTKRAVRRCGVRISIAL